MKTLPLIVGLMLVFSGIMSCTQDDSVLNRGDKDLELEMERMLQGCSGNGACLPNVSVSCTSSVVRVSWERSVYNNHPFTFAYFINGQIYRVEPIGDRGSMDIQVESLYANSSFFYTLTCMSCPATCIRQESKALRGGNFTGESVGYGDCFKQYYSYTIQSFDSWKLVLRRSDTSVSDPSDYMGVNAASISVYNSSGILESRGLHVSVNDTTRIITIDGFMFEHGKTYEIRLYNTNLCPITSAHYMRIVCSYDSLRGITISRGLESVNFHGN